jgi:isocitrate lyase
MRVALRPHRAGSELLELQVRNGSTSLIANVIFATIQDRRGRTILSVRDQNTFDPACRQKRLMTLIHLYLIHRYKAEAAHYVTPTDDNRYQTNKMKSHGIFSDVRDEVGDIIVANVDAERVNALIQPGGAELEALIAKRYP